MTFSTRMLYLKLEQDEMLRILDRVDEALKQATSEDFESRLKALADLHSLERGLTGIGEHCRSEDRVVESTFRHYLNQPEYARMNAEHAEILRLLSNFRNELEFATADSTAVLVPLGKELTTYVRAHLSYERKILESVEMSGAVPNELMMRYTESPE
jgi:hypothetical protein